MNSSKNMTWILVPVTVVGIIISLSILTESKSSIVEREFEEFKEFDEYEDNMDKDDFYEDDYDEEYYDENDYDDPEHVVDEDEEYDLDLPNDDHDTKGLFNDGKEGKQDNEGLLNNDDDSEIKNHNDL